jgi:hypothetical protein
MKNFLFLSIFILSGLYVSAQNAVFEQVAGTVEIKQPKETIFKAANNGDQLFQETVISTGFKSFAIIKTGSTSITIRPLTLLSLTEIQKLAESETLEVNLQAGKIRVDVKPPAGTRASATIRTATATASVRGTSFEFDTRNLYVNEGTVIFSGNRGQSFLVGAGGTSRVDQTGRASNPAEERILNLMPPSLAGTGAGNSAASNSAAAAGVSFVIELEIEELRN